MPASAKITSGGEQLLAGTIVLERSHTVAAAYAGQMLAGLGARVHRVDGPLDVVARLTPGFAEVVADFLNRGKSSLTPVDADRVAFVAATADVLLCDETPQGPDGLDAMLIASVRDDAIMASAQSMGRCWPDAAPLPGNGLTAAAWSGLSIVIGSPDKAPLTLPFDLPEYEAGANLAAATVLALIQRDLNVGRSRHVEVACAEVLAYYCGMIAANFVPYGRPWRREGRRASGSGGVYPLGIFKCRDGLIALMCRTPREWHGLLDAMGNPEWSTTPDFRDPRIIAREHADEADSYLEPWLAALSVDDLVELGRIHGVPVAAIRTMNEAIADPQLEERHFFDPTGPAAAPRVPTEPFRIQWHERDPEPGSTGSGWPKNSYFESEIPRLLRGLRVLDFSWVWSGPMVTSILADFGADIIKVEHERHLDPGRLRGRAQRDGVPVAGPEYEVTPYFNQMNHGKRSIIVDLTSNEGRKVLTRLSSTCDVIVENMRPGVLTRHGLGYDDLSASNPGLVMLSMSMAGQEGPLRDLKGYASIMSAMAGVEALVGYDRDDVVGMLTPALGDPNAAAHAITVLLAALHHRATSVDGRGAWIDLSQIEAMLSVLRSPIAEAQAFGTPDIPGNTHPRHVPHGHFPTAETDRWIAVTVRTDDEWRALCRAAADDLKLSAWEELTTSERIVRRIEIEAVLGSWTATYPGRFLEAMLRSAGVPAAVVQTYEEMVQELSSRSPTLCAPVPHPYLGEQTTFFVPWRFDGSAGGCRLPAPLLGADTNAVLDPYLAGGQFAS